MAAPKAVGQRSQKRKRAHDEPDSAIHDSRAKKGRTHGHTKLQSQSRPEAGVDPSTSPFTTIPKAFYLPLSPTSSGIGSALKGLCAEHLAPLLLTYYEPLGGVVLSYTKEALSSTQPSLGELTRKSEEVPMARAVSENAAPHVWLSADFELLVPRRGVKVQGYVSIVAESHVGLICYNLFNASIPARYLPKGWTYQAGPTDGVDSASEGEGQWVDKHGRVVCAANSEAPTVLEFTVRDFDSSGGTFGVGARDRGFLTMEGTLLSNEEEAELAEADRKQQQQQQQKQREQQKKQQERQLKQQDQQEKQKSVRFSNGHVDSQRESKKTKRQKTNGHAAM